MLYERLTAKARAGDGLDAVRTDAIEKVRWLVDLLDRQRENWTEQLACRDRERHERLSTEMDLIGTKIREGLGSCGHDERRAAAVVLTLAAEFTDTLWDYDEELALVVPGTRGWSAPEASALLAHVEACHMAFWFARSLGFALTAAEALDVDDQRTVAPLLQRIHRRLIDEEGVGAGHYSALARRIWRLLKNVDGTRFPAGTIPDHDPWAEPLREHANASPTPELVDLVLHLAALSGPRPSERWRRRCLELLDATGAVDLPSRCLRGLAEGEALCSREHGPLPSWPFDHHHHYLVRPTHVDLARGLVWSAALVDGAATVHDLVALALRTGGPDGDVVEQLKLAGAAVNALGGIDGPSTLEALWRLQRTIRHRGLRKQLDTALRTAAGRQGITPEQLIERSVPAHGLAADGSATRELGDHRAVVSVENAATVRLSFALPDGRRARTVPAALKEPYAEELKELKSLVKEIRGTLSGERARLEGLMSAERRWTYQEWSRHYRDHPVTGAVTRDLIWEFAGPDGAWTAAVPSGPGLLRADGRELPPPAAHTPVRLWHPIRAAADEITAWREFVTGRRMRQPFKQAFREIYLPTPAELETGGYSNRFAAHIVHYPRLYALFKTRGWRANFLGPYDGGHDGEARGTFAEGEWQACFYHESVEAEDVDHRPDYAATDQVRFERRTGRTWRRVPLAEVPAIVFSEAMRDVDMFVAVTSIAADPDWADRGEDRYAAYWRSASFGELTAGAEVRRDALARILPRTRIADRCRLDDRHLVVRGDLRIYKIHLGSANVLMEPDDSYLCIVPARRSTGGGLYLPFEDERLSLILSKAFLLAADTEITDGSILRQITRGTPP
ncbi:DUF4132 domain-containing protein [Thermomonospora cellulosilytica]|uniref:DUF4132 domain-containing protein n=1 Tax=Thermomonospora cellulosilytica TaxID=1411118 RepID=A0A7W3N1K2_9ACTN|nr:DUF4132 domain-containing protein [Thermomonospora cellulosilytica]MBA9005817.1 hypothetical protein [Thermomonospora cellulosilytica]